MSMIHAFVAAEVGYWGLQIIIGDVDSFSAHAAGLIGCMRDQDPWHTNHT